MNETGNSRGASARATAAANLTDAERKTDWAGRKLLGQKIIAAHILRDGVPAFDGWDPRWIALNSIERRSGDPACEAQSGQDFGVIAGRNPEILLPSGDKIQMDLRFEALTPPDESGLREELLVGLDIQNESWPGYPLAERMSDYAVHSFIHQEAETEGKYAAGRHSTWSVWICVKPPVGMENTIVHAGGDARWWIGPKRPMLPPAVKLPSIAQINLGDPDKAEPGSTLRLLGILLRSAKPTWEKLEILETEFGIDITTDIEQEVIEMSTWFQDAVQEAAQEVAQKTVREAVQKASVNTLRNSMIQLVREGHLSADVAAQNLGISVEEFRALAEPS